MTRPADHYCLICRYATERHLTDGVTTFKHVAVQERWDGPAHDPLPAPMSELTARNEVCDFCSAANPALAYRFPNVRLTTRTPATTRVDDLGEWWLACRGCAVPIDLLDPADLLRRVQIMLSGKVSRAALRTQLQPVYRQLLKRPPLEKLPAAEVRW
jgi:hypothetical protein